MPTDDEWEAAWKLFRNGEPRDPGIVDHVSFLLMRRLGIKKAFTNDAHFKEMGFETLF